MNSGEIPQVNPRRKVRLRLSVAGLMVLVALSAIVLFVYESAERQHRKLIAQAVSVIQTNRPDIDLTDFDVTLGKTSADGQFTAIDFQSRSDRRTMFGVTVPRSGQRPHN